MSLSTLIDDQDQSCFRAAGEERARRLKFLTRRLLTRISALLALAVLSSGCFRPPPTTVPLRTIDMAGGSPDSKCLVIFLQGRGDTPEHFVRNDFPEKLHEAGSRCATMGVDAHMGYYLERSIGDRLHEDVIAPAKAEGFEEIWLVGISIGGFGSLLYTKDHPGEIDGIVALSPFLGDKKLIGDIQAAGGVDSWHPEETPMMKDFIAFWAWLKGYRASDDDHPPLFLAYGRGDRFAEANGLLAEMLPADHVFHVQGGHTWRTWRRAWDAFLKSEYVPGRTASTRSAAAPTYSGRSASRRSGS